MFYGTECKFFNVIMLVPHTLLCGLFLVYKNEDDNLHIFMVTRLC